MLAGQQYDDAPVAASHGLTTSEVEDTKPMVTDEPDAGIPHVRVCGGDGWATSVSTRQMITQSHAEETQSLTEIF